ncbi:MAG TPA: hypothetical protein VGX69_11505 [Solirubrobacteraceae bacterium]|nr:hypothetical protein [Solirubrobacteraceae bacterium]
MLGAALIVCAAGCGEQLTPARLHQMEAEKPCDFGKPYACKIQREGEALRKAAVEYQEEHAAPGG